jgi:hypothetical protein
MSLVKRGGNNPFYSPDDGMDDDAFLNHPRAGSSGYMLPQSSSMTSTSPRPNSSQSTTNTVENRQNQLQLERHEIEQRTIDSSNRSLGLLFESERVGAATGEELSRQKEQLLRTEGRLDDINSTLKTSERHLQVNPKKYLVDNFQQFSLIRGFLRFPPRFHGKAFGKKIRNYNQKKFGQRTSASNLGSVCNLEEY